MIGVADGGYRLTPDVLIAHIAPRSDRLTLLHHRSADSQAQNCRQLLQYFTDFA